MPASLPTHVREHLGSLLRTAYGETEPAGVPETMAPAILRLEAALSARGERLGRGMREGLADAAPSLKVFAMSLTRNPTAADDLVQETLLKAWANQARFQPGTNLRSWLFTIMRNHFYGEHRKRRREVEDADGGYASRLSSAPAQGVGLDLRDMDAALNILPAEQREAIMLIAVGDATYDEAAEAMGCKAGTVKSRVSRGRRRLAEILGYEGHEIGPDLGMASALADA